jgi:hypothetical protein
MSDVTDVFGKGFNVQVQKAAPHALLVSKTV